MRTFAKFRPFGFGGAVKNAGVALVTWEGYLRSFRLFEGDFFLGSSSSEPFHGIVPNHVMKDKSLGETTRFRHQSTRISFFWKGPHSSKCKNVVFFWGGALSLLRKNILSCPW